MRDARRRPLFRLPWRTERRIREDVEAEIRFHLAAAVDELVAAGMSPERARAEALRRFGNVDDARSYMAAVDRGTEAAQRRSEWMRDFRHDLSYAARTLRKSPAFTIVAVLTLALGIGANTAIFSVVNGVLLQPLPFPDPDRLVRVRITDRGEEDAASPVNARDVAERTHSITGVSIIDGETVNLAADRGDPERIVGVGVSANFFDVLEVRPALGRGFVAGEDVQGAPRVAVISDALWRRRFEGDPRVVGRVVRMNGEPTTIVGVMPRGHEYPITVHIWTPVQYRPRQLSDEARGARWVGLFARLKPGATMDGFARELTSLSESLDREFPNKYDHFRMSPVVLRDWLVGDVRKPLLVILGGVALVLLIACANVANLLLVRATARESEMAVRTALGAGRARLVRQLVTESLVLTLAGGVLGLLFARLGMHWLLGLAPDLPRVQSASIDATALALTAAVAIATGIVFGILPARELGRGDLATALRAGSRGARTHAGASRAKRAIVIGEVALAVTLLTGAGLLLRSFSHLVSVDPGFRPEQVLTFRADLPDQGYPRDVDIVRFVDALHQRLSAIPGVRAGAIATQLPLDGGDFTISFTIRGRPKPKPTDEPSAQITVVTPDFFAAIGNPIHRGRGFTVADRAGAPRVAIVNEAFVRRHFANEDPVGKYVDLGWSSDSVRMGGEIVGVVADVKQQGLDHAPVPTLYMPFGQAALSTLRFAVRTAVPPASIASAVRASIRELDPQLPVFNMRPMTAMVAESVGQQRFLTTLIGAFAGVALLLAAVGLYGVIAYVVGQRTHELGVRIALGATGERVSRMVVSDGLAMVAVGLVVGLLASLALGRVLRTLLFDVSTTDPITFGAVAATLLAIAALASWIPARRAGRVDPLVAMRGD